MGARGRGRILSFSIVILSFCFFCGIRLIIGKVSNFCVSKADTRFNGSKLIAYWRHFGAFEILGCLLFSLHYETSPESK